MIMLSFYMVEDLIARGILDKGLGQDNFCNWAQEANENKEIRNYLNDLKREYGYDSFDKFEEFVQKCKI